MPGQYDALRRCATITARRMVPPYVHAQTLAAMGVNHKTRQSTSPLTMTRAQYEISHVVRSSALGGALEVESGFDGSGIFPRVSKFRFSHQSAESRTAPMSLPRLDTGRDADARCVK